LDIAKEVLLMLLHQPERGLHQAQESHRPAHAGGIGCRDFLNEFDLPGDPRFRLRDAVFGFREKSQSTAAFWHGACRGYGPAGPAYVDMFGPTFGGIELAAETNIGQQVPRSPADLVGSRSKFQYGSHCRAQPCRA